MSKFILALSFLAVIGCVPKTEKPAAVAQVQPAQVVQGKQVVRPGFPVWNGSAAEYVATGGWRRLQDVPAGSSIWIVSTGGTAVYVIWYPPGTNQFREYFYDAKGILKFRPIAPQQWTHQASVLIGAFQVSDFIEETNVLRSATPALYKWTDTSGAGVWPEPF